MTCDPWPPDMTCLPDGWAPDVAAWTAAQRASRDVAQDLLSRLAVRPYGLCTRLVRPCSQACGRAAGYLPAGRWFAPALVNGWVVNACRCAAGDGCSCGPLAEVLLPAPVYDVVSVLVDGELLDPAAYRVDDWSRLVRLDGQQWPTCQRLDLDETEPDTFAVTYRRGLPVPPAGRRALTALTIEIDKARCGDQTCRLPSKVTNVVRDGVTYSLLDDPNTLLDSGRTGVPEVDQWLAAVNPYKAKSEMRVYSPDLRPPRRRTWPVS